MVSRRQGGGALGSYQAGVYTGAGRSRLHPDWVAGISIGAVNSAIIAGNPPERRVERLRKFWETEAVAAASRRSPRQRRFPASRSTSSARWQAFMGVPGFFQPRVPPSVFVPPGTPDALSFYDTCAAHAR